MVRDMENISIEKVEISLPDISKDTWGEMEQFFLKTSIPRILAEMNKKEGSKNGWQILSNKS